jgi:DNA polymerase-3 subunit gamma/tau
MTDQSARLGTATLSRLADIVHTGLTEMRGTTSPRLLLELVSARMLLPAASTDGAALLQRLERMERRLSVTSAPVGEDVGVERPAEPGGAGGAPETAKVAAGRRPPAKEVGEAPSGGRRRPAGAEAAPAAVQPPPPPVQPAGAVEPAPPATAAPTPAVGPVDAAAVRRIWPEVLDAAKRRRRTTHALLMNVSVHSVDHGILTLTISSEPLSRILAQEVNTDVVRGAVRDVLGVDWRVQVRVDGGPAVGGADPVAAAVPPPEEDPREDEPSPPSAGGGPPARTDPEEAAISLLESTLGARRVEDRG